MLESVSDPLTNSIPGMLAVGLRHMRGRAAGPSGTVLGTNPSKDNEL